MRSEDSLFVLLAVIIGVPVAIWFYQDTLLGIAQFADVMVLRALSWVPLFGGYYENVANQYSALSPSQLRFQHTWIAGTIAWRPVTLLLVTPMMLYWAWTAYKLRSEQSFKKMDKTFLDKHLKTKQTAQGKSRQQWTVRHWFHFYKLNTMAWGSARWHRRINEAFCKQLGMPTGTKEGDALVKEFAEFMNEQAITQFGEGSAAMLPAKIAYEEAISRHAYVSTAMVRVLAAFRDQFGVLSPNPFRNRLFKSPATVPIWFALNGFYRQTTHIESLAILSHFYEETAKGEMIKEPQMHNALEGLEQYREHHVERRKLSDLDETKKLAEAAERKRQEERAGTERAPAEKRYNADEQILT